MLLRQCLFKKRMLSLIWTDSIEHLFDVRGNSRSCRETWRFNANEVDESRHVLADNKIPEFFAGTLELRPYAGHIRNDILSADKGEKLHCSLVESGTLIRIDLVIFSSADIGRIRTQLHSAGQITSP